MSQDRHELGGLFSIVRCRTVDPVSLSWGESILAIISMYQTSRLPGFFICKQEITITQEKDGKDAGRDPTRRAQPDGRLLGDGDDRRHDVSEQQGKKDAPPGFRRNALDNAAYRPEQQAKSEQRRAEHAHESRHLPVGLHVQAGHLWYGEKGHHQRTVQGKGNPEGNEQDGVDVDEQG